MGRRQLNSFQVSSATHFLTAEISATNVRTTTVLSNTSQEPGALNDMLSIWAEQQRPRFMNDRLERKIQRAGVRAIIGCAWSPYSVKVHKIENFFGFDFEICNISVLVMPNIKICKKILIGPVLGEVRFFRVVLRLRGMKKFFLLGQKYFFCFFHL